MIHIKKINTFTLLKWLSVKLQKYSWGCKAPEIIIVTAKYENDDYKHEL